MPASISAEENDRTVIDPGHSPSTSFEDIAQLDQCPTFEIPLVDVVAGTGEDNDPF